MRASEQSSGCEQTFTGVQKKECVVTAGWCELLCMSLGYGLLQVKKLLADGVGEGCEGFSRKDVEYYANAVTVLGFTIACAHLPPSAS
jgi:hypothetical protein